MTKEIPKRLAPTRNTLRELYLKSGNRCAYAGCKKALFNRKGVFVAQICHIESAEPGGERFNNDQTNEQRRSFANLMLMCYDHHVETNNVKVFTVEHMQRMKSQHEKKYSDVVGTILSTVVDHTKLAEPSFAKSLCAMNKVLKWNLSPEELKECVEELEDMVRRLSRIPLSSRELFQILVERCEKGGFGAKLAIGTPEVRQVTGLTNAELSGCFSILDKNVLLTTMGQMISVSRRSAFMISGPGGLSGWILRSFVKKPILILPI